MRRIFLSIVLLIVHAQLSLATAFEVTEKETASKRIDLGDGVAIEFVLIKSGTFLMGTSVPNPLNSTRLKDDVESGKRITSIGMVLLLLTILEIILRSRSRAIPIRFSLLKLIVIHLFLGISVFGVVRWNNAHSLLQKHNLHLLHLKDISPRESPSHTVSITKSFYISIHEITQEQWKRMMGSNNSRFKGERLPVEYVSWLEAQEFCYRLSAYNGGAVFRLPTEAEWEYSCRAGSDSIYSFGDADVALNEYAWYADNSSDTTHPVGIKKANAWGLYDMHGNVYEWCSDWYNHYESKSEIDPKGPLTGERRVVRGGSYYGSGKVCSSAYREGSLPEHRTAVCGFRIVMEFNKSR